MEHKQFEFESETYSIIDCLRTGIVVMLIDMQGMGRQTAVVNMNEKKILFTVPKPESEIHNFASFERFKELLDWVYSESETDLISQTFL